MEDHYEIIAVIVVRNGPEVWDSPTRGRYKAFYRAVYEHSDTIDEPVKEVELRYLEHTFFDQHTSQPLAP